MLVAAGFAFAVSLGEFGATVFLARADWPTVPVAIYRFLGQPGPLNFGQAMALSTILMVLTVVVMVLVERFRVGTGGRVLMLEIHDLVVDLDGQRVARRCLVLGGGRGEVTAVLGPSGSGKTTLLRAVAGLQAASSGRVALDGRDLADVPPHQRGLGMMFQDYALFPHLDVAGNVGFGLRMRGDGSRRASTLGSPRCSSSSA